MASRKPNIYFDRLFMRFTLYRAFNSLQSWPVNKIIYSILSRVCVHTHSRLRYLIRLKPPWPSHSWEHGVTSFSNRVHREWRCFESYSRLQKSLCALSYKETLLDRNFFFTSKPNSNSLERILLLLYIFLLSQEIWVVNEPIFFQLLKFESN